MKTAVAKFNERVRDIKKMRAYYVHLNEYYHIPEEELSDLLRAELVNIVSGMDQFFHEIVRIGILNSYRGISPQTDKYRTIPFNFLVLQKIIHCTSIKKPTCNEELPEYWIGNGVIDFLKTFSFQKIDKIKDALSFIWDEPHKLQLVIQKMTYSNFPNSVINKKQKFLEEKMDLIVLRRNQIVHEADFDIFTGSKQSIKLSWVDDAIIFIIDFVYAVYECITNDNSYERVLFLH